MMGYFREKGYHTLWEIMIDENHQNKGYGKQAVLLGVKFLKNKFGVKEIYLLQTATMLPQYIFMNLSDLSLRASLKTMR